MNYFKNEENDKKEKSEMKVKMKDIFNLPKSNKIVNKIKKKEKQQNKNTKGS
jgi:hypothetical protein